MDDILSKTSFELFKSVTNKSTDDVILMMLESTLFINPDIVKETPVKMPYAVRESNEYHSGIKRGNKSKWNGDEVNVYDNNKARDAFGQYAKLNMGGVNRNVPKGLHVAHIWERVFDPNFFTAGWNICLMPDFLKIYTEKQAGTEEVAKCLKQAGYDIYFKSGIIKENEYVEDLGIDLNSRFPGWSPNFTKRYKNTTINRLTKLKRENVAMARLNLNYNVLNLDNIEYEVANSTQSTINKVIRARELKDQGLSVDHIAAQLDLSISRVKELLTGVNWVSKEKCYKVVGGVD